MHRRSTLHRTNFNSLTPENDLKWFVVQPEPVAFAFAFVDAVIGWAETEGIGVKGHTLVWEQDLLDGLPNRVRVARIGFEGIDRARGSIPASTQFVVRRKDALALVHETDVAVAGTTPDDPARPCRSPSGAGDA